MSKLRWWAVFALVVCVPAWSGCGERATSKASRDAGDGEDDSDSVLDEDDDGDDGDDPLGSSDDVADDVDDAPPLGNMDAVNPFDLLADLFGNLQGDAGTPTSSCDPDVPTTASCGGASCPASSGGLAGLVCLVPCCLPDDTCGTRRATLEGPTECEAPGVPDLACPPYANGASELEGCCAASGRCGVISGIDGRCITSSGLLPDLEPGDVCGGDPPVDAGMSGPDAGSTMDASASDSGGDPEDAATEPDTGVDDEDAGV